MDRLNGGPRENMVLPFSVKFSVYKEFSPR